MKLNERIYSLRMAMKLSQGDLADALGVSRQSISKWETGAAVPEIDHLVRLSEIFGVTLDELVKGEAPKEAASESSQAVGGSTQTVIVYREREPRKTAALVLLIAGFLCIFAGLLGAGGLGFLFAIPLFLCALVCILFRRRVGLWCGWTVLLLVDVFLSLSTGVMNSWWHYLRAALHGIPIESGGTIQIIVSILMTLWEIGMIVATVLSYRSYRIGVTVKNLICVIAGWVGWVAMRLGSILLSQAMLNAVIDSTLPYGWIRTINLIYQLVSTFGLAPLLVFTVALIQSYREMRRGGALKK
ncbi:MAG: helix-turn-helix transcriptional regulator [Clostridia bacterium]|nr:helix-turn-helix transcriptional regulator [Clostridia bacterium]